ncbi:MAG: hypothetical protein QOJ34_520, partial [Pseudonocardiales bacterium]|nr:hypothetical protein [Pseudonocardiales bacterium]
MDELSPESAPTAATPPPPQHFPLHVLEDDENIPPRPEEELADIERSDPDQ